MEKWSLTYAIIKFILKIPHSVFYRKIIIEGIENVPKNKPVIFAPNHQNAVMDPLAMIFSTNKQPVFLARGDAFNNPTIAKIFAVLKILPVFRQRDGMEQLKKNGAIFQKSVDVLKNNNAFCLFPEGQHNPKRFLRPLQKAIPRIAFQAEEQTNYQLDIKIIPTGIYYEDKTKSLGILHIHYGKSIDVLDYVDSYKDNQQKAMNSLKQKMFQGLKPLMIDIQDKENYDLIEDSLTIYIPYYLQKNRLKNTQRNRFNASKTIIANLENKLKSENNIAAQLNKKLLELKDTILPLNISLSDFFSANKSWGNAIIKSLLLLTLLPLFLVGCIINILPQQIAPYVSKNLLKDPQYIGSVKFVIGGIVFPIYYLILSLISLFFIDAIYSLIALITLPILGLFNVYYKYFFKSLRNSLKYLILDKSKKNIIIDKINEYVNFIHSK